MRFRIATQQDISSIAAIYERIHDQEETGTTTIGWVRGIYPVRRTAEDALNRGDLFVCEVDGAIVASGVINNKQVPEYVLGEWTHPVAEDEALVLHTLTVDPEHAGQGIGKSFVEYYERYAQEHGYHELRIDTNVRNRIARVLYPRLGYQERGIVPCDFNGIEHVQLVLFEKYLTY